MNSFARNLAAICFAASAIVMVSRSARGIPPRSPASQPAAAAVIPDAVVQELRTALADNRLAAHAQALQSKLKLLLADAAKVDQVELTRLETARSFCRYFGRIEKLDEQDKRLLANLIDRPKFYRTLMLAVSEFDPPDGLLAVLRAMRVSFDRDAETAPDLATAFCVVWDTPTLTVDSPPSTQPAAEPPVKLPRWDHAQWLWNFYTAGRARFPHDDKELPWQLAEYLVENPAGTDETSWALDRYASAFSPADAYFDVPYDPSIVYRRGDQKNGGADYTLFNLTNLGGASVEQAYVASVVGRMFGQPAIVVTRQGAAGTRQAWAAFLEREDKHLTWNFRDARYPEQLQWRGTVSDPQSREEMPDAYVGPSARLSETTVENRLASLAFLRAMDLAPEDQQFPLALRAIAMSPGDREAWLFAADWCSKSKADATQSAALRAAAGRFVLGDYPDFAYAILTKAISGRGAIQQLDALETLGQLFKSNPDLRARSLLAQATILRHNRQRDRAMRLYGEVLADNSISGYVMVEALDAVESVLRDERDLERLAAIYEQTWEYLPKPAQSVMARATPFYEIGKRYEALLREIGDDSEAIAVRSRLVASDVAETIKRSGRTR